MELKLVLPYSKIFFKVRVKKSREPIAVDNYDTGKIKEDYPLERARLYPLGPDFDTQSFTRNFW